MHHGEIAWRGESRIPGSHGEREAQTRAVVARVARHAGVVDPRAARASTERGAFVEASAFHNRTEDNRGDKEKAAQKVWRCSRSTPSPEERRGGASSSASQHFRSSSGTSRCAPGT
jgi:hypothetical protein